MLSFDSKRCVSDFLAAIDRELDIVARHGVEYMVYEIGKTLGSKTIGGKTEWKQNVIEALKHRGQVQALKVIKEFGLIEPDELTLNQAFLVNYGTGHTTDTSHPHFDEYVRSAFFDATRQGMVIQTRPGELVYDYNTGDWKRSRSKTKRQLPQLHQLPSYFFENALAFIDQEFNDAIEKVIEEFDFSKYLTSSIK